MVRNLVQEHEFIEVYMNTPIDECERRDPKGLYKKARSGEIKNFTGVDSAYEAPEVPEVQIDTVSLSIEECADQIINYLKENRIIN
jgi:adenylylsulfate kinase-like enzyme